jgi:hypothetical protein
MLGIIIYKTLYQRVEWNKGKLNLKETKVVSLV